MLTKKLILGIIFLYFLYKSVYYIEKNKIKINHINNLESGVRKMEDVEIFTEKNIRIFSILHWLIT